MNVLTASSLNLNDLENTIEDDFSLCWHHLSQGSLCVENTAASLTGLNGLILKLWSCCFSSTYFWSDTTMYARRWNNQLEDQFVICDYWISTLFLELCSHLVSIHIQYIYLNQLWVPYIHSTYLNNKFCSLTVHTSIMSSVHLQYISRLWVPYIYSTYLNYASSALLQYILSQL